MTRKDLMVLIPALNEEEAIGAVVSAARQVLDGDVVVVDDGSTDATMQKAMAAGATVLPLPYNLGVGGAIRTGLRYAEKMGYRAVVQLDGDGQHEAEEAKKLLDALDATGVDLVIGSRFAAGYKVSIGRRSMMRILSAIITRGLGTRVTDTTSGFRAMGPRCIAAFASHYPVDYLSDTVEALLLAGRAGLRVTEVDVRMQPRQGGTASASSLRSIYHLLRLFLIIILSAIRGRRDEG